MSALGHLRVPLAAFVAAALGGVGLGLALQDDDEARPASRAVAPPAGTTELPTQEIPSTPGLRLGTSPTAAPVVVTPSAPQAQTPAATPQTPAQQQGSNGSSGGSGFQVTDESVASP